MLINTVSQLDDVQKVRYLKTLSPKWDVLKLPIPSELREPCKRGNNRTVRENQARTLRRRDSETERQIHIATHKEYDRMHKPA